MKDKTYLNLRKWLFRIFFTTFMVLTPIIVFYSLGYKFNVVLKKFQKTGAIAVKCFPKDVNVYLDNKKINGSAPYTIRELLPNIYKLRIEKEYFYPYEIPVEVKSSLISEIYVNLMPKIRNMEKLPINLNIYKFFVLERLFGKSILIFSENGIYLLNEDFVNIRKISDLSIDKSIIGNIEGIREGKNQFIFWSKNNIWLVKTHAFQDDGKAEVLNIYSASEVIKEVFFCLKGQYLLIYDGVKIVALDAKNTSVFFPIMEVKTAIADVFYDSAADILYIKDRISFQENFSLFKINLMDLIYEKKSE